MLPVCLCQGFAASPELLSALPLSVSLPAFVSLSLLPSYTNTTQQTQPLILSQGLHDSNPSWSHLLNLNFFFFFSLPLQTSLFIGPGSEWGERKFPLYKSCITANGFRVVLNNMWWIQMCGTLPGRPLQKKKSKPKIQYSLTERRHCTKPPASTLAVSTLCEGQSFHDELTNWHRKGQFEPNKWTYTDVLGKWKKVSHCRHNTLTI